MYSLQAMKTQGVVFVGWINLFSKVMPHTLSIIIFVLTEGKDKKGF